MLQVNTELLLRELNTDGHAPLEFVCDTGDIYYCKYLKTFNKNEINCLAYEFVASSILSKFEIPTPQVALVHISTGTLNQSLIKYNRRLAEGDFCFGSKGIKFANELQDIQDFSKYDYNRIINPEDIIKIAFFDLWVDNMDRGKITPTGVNYNLLLEPVNLKQRLIAFDHAFIFGGVHEIGTFNRTATVSSYHKLIGTTFFKNAVKRVEKNRFEEIVENFVILLASYEEKEIVRIIKNLSGIWSLTPNLDQRILNFLSDNNRLKACKQQMLQSKK